MSEDLNIQNSPDATSNGGAAGDGLSMLEIRNITKVYRSKTGESVKALDNISIKFPDTGMIFILGKSGSGKSTLLNVSGGLDGYDSGEFVIMGKSSKDFVGSDFDAYRNTFIGFIFQEYNILDDFSVGANIGLALELQGKKATSEAIENILSQVDLAGYAHRKPNELSGGQKQRIAIARALVKEPQIIMADEPTGALDSNTGKQVFDTLKELSKRKLVLIVSHDRDFAEKYADRIIELKDGTIIRDDTKRQRPGVQINEGVQKSGENILRIRGGYQLTPADVKMINEYLALAEGDLMISGDTRVNAELRSAARITEDGSTTTFEQTDADADVPVRKYDGKKTKFIRSRLPMKNAVKMGSSGLKHKKFRLFLTILLSLVAFGMFGLADTMAAYEKVSNAVRSIRDSNVANASVSLGVKTTNYWTDGDKERENSYYYNTAMNDADIAWLKTQTGIAFVPVFNGSNGGAGGISLTGLMKGYKSEAVAYRGELSGFVSMDAAALSAAGLTVQGRLPQNENEIAITRFMFDQFYRYGFKNDLDGHDESVNAKQLTDDAGVNSIIGKHLTFSDGNIYKDDYKNFDYVIVGVIDTHFESDRYERFLPSDTPAVEAETTIGDMLLQMELTDTLQYGFHTLGFVTDKAITEMAKNASRMNNEYDQIGEYTNSLSLRIVTGTGDEKGGESGQFINRVAGSADISKLRVTWLNGTPRTTLGEKEYLVSRQAYRNIFNPWIQADVSLSALNDRMTELFGDAWTTPPASYKGQYFDRMEMAACYRYATDHYAGNEVTLADNCNVYSVEEYANYLYDYGNDPLGGDFTAAMDAADAQFYTAVAALYGITESVDLRAAEALASRYVAGANVEDTERQRSNTDIAYDLAAYYATHEIYTTDLWQNEALAAAAKRYSSVTDDSWDAKSTDEKKNIICNYYENYLGNHNDPSNAYGATSFDKISRDSLAVLEAWAGRQLVASPVIRATVNDWSDGYERKIDKGTYEDWTIVGYFDDGDGYLSDLVVSDTLAQLNSDVAKEYNFYSSRTVTAEHAAGIWAFAIAPMPSDNAAIQKLVEMSYDETGDLNFGLQNQVMNTLDTFNDFIETGAKIFLYVGIGFAAFSALLLMNFISISISYKKREIGILRAVGARSSDVFKIFFSEAFIIAFINYVLAVAAAVTAIFFINRWMRNSGINVTLLNFGVRQLALMLLISVGVAALASFLPVWRIARRKPIDAIRDR